MNVIICMVHDLTCTRVLPNVIACMMHDVTYTRALPTVITCMMHDITCMIAVPNDITCTRALLNVITCIMHVITFGRALVHCACYIIRKTSRACYIGKALGYVITCIMYAKKYFCVTSLLNHCTLVIPNFLISLL